MKKLIIASFSVLAFAMTFTGCGGGSASSSDNNNIDSAVVDNGTAVVNNVRGLTQFPAVPSVPE